MNKLFIRAMSIWVLDTQSSTILYPVMLKVLHDEQLSLDEEMTFSRGVSIFRMELVHNPSMSRVMCLARELTNNN